MARTNIRHKIHMVNEPARRCPERPRYDEIEGAEHDHEYGGASPFDAATATGMYDY